MKYIKMINDQIIKLVFFIFLIHLNSIWHLQGEDICAAAIREVKEETGVSEHIINV